MDSLFFLRLLTVVRRQRKTRRRTQIVFGIATLDLVFASFNALAQSQPMSVAVDLDRRGGDVAESVCSPLHGSRSLRTQIQWRNCRYSGTVPRPCCPCVSKPR